MPSADVKDRGDVRKVIPAKTVATLDLTAKRCKV